MIEDPLRILIVGGRGAGDLADRLLAAAKGELAAAKAEFDVATVQGVFEIPAVIAMAEEGGHRPAGVRYDGYVALGCTVRDGALHSELAANECARGLMELAIGRRLAIGNGVLAIDPKGAVIPPASGEAGSGAAAARACLAVIALKRRLLGQVR
jgi:6,7-dimethyl-8-ribityllumazine synthase